MQFFLNHPKSCCAHLQNRLALKSDWWWTCDVVPGLINGSSQSFWTSVVSVGGKEVHHSLGSDCQTQTPPTVMCLEQSPLFQHFFTPGWFSPLLHCPSVPPPLPVFLTFLVQFPFLYPGVLTAEQMKTLGSSSSVSEEVLRVFVWYTGELPSQKHLSRTSRQPRVEIRN